MPMVKQMAYENANRYCKEALHPHRKKSLNDYIRICRDIDGNYIQGQVLATALGPQRRGNNNGATKGQLALVVAKLDIFAKSAQKFK